MKLPPFTLVYHGPGQTDKRLARLTGSTAMNIGDLFDEQLKVVRKRKPKLAASLEVMNRKLGSALLGSAFMHASTTPLADAVTDNLIPTVADLRRAEKVVTVAIWDLGARIGRLPQLIFEMNAAQPNFTFFNLRAAIPAGPLSRSTNAADWQRRSGRLLSKLQRKDIVHNIFADGFYDQARPIQKQLGVDYLVGITPSMIAIEEDDDVFWNFFSSGDGPLMLASAYDLRRYARAARRPFVVAVAIIVLGQLLATVNPRVEFHKDSGCLFDFTANRDQIVNVIKEPKVDTVCFGRIKKQYRSAVSALMEKLRIYEDEYEVAEHSSTKAVAGHDDKFWLQRLAQLNSESEE